MYKVSVLSTLRQEGVWIGEKMKHYYLRRMYLYLIQISFSIFTLFGSSDNWRVGYWSLNKWHPTVCCTFWLEKVLSGRVPTAAGTSLFNPETKQWDLQQYSEDSLLHGCRISLMLVLIQVIKWAVSSPICLAWPHSHAVEILWFIWRNFRTFAIISPVLKEAKSIHMCDINIFRMIVDMSEMFLHTMSGSWKGQ